MGELTKAGRRGSCLRAVGATLPRDHLLCRADRLLDMAELCAAPAPHDSPRGRPSVAPSS